MVATVLGAGVHTTDAEEMRYVILSKLLESYAAEQGIEVERADVDAYLNGTRRIAEAHRRRNEARCRELTRKLNSGNLGEAERRKVSSELDSLNELMATLEEMSAAANEDPQASQKDREQVAAAFIRQWKINRALFRQYGGRVIFQQGGAEPLDAYRRFLEAQEKRGRFAIADEVFAKKFWDYYRNDARHSFYPPGSVQAAQAIEIPWWLTDQP